MDYFKLGQAVNILLEKFNYKNRYTAIARWNGVGIQLKKGKHVNYQEFNEVINNITNELRKYGIKNIIINEDQLRETLIKIAK